MDSVARTGTDELRSIARRVMLQRGLLADFSPEVRRETNAITKAATTTGTAIRDLRGLLWASIDNDDWRDLDPLSVAQPLAGGAVRILIAIADVDAIVTGASETGTWVRTAHPTVEGRVVRGFDGLDVGDRVRVELVHTDAARGFIDFVRSRETI